MVDPSSPGHCRRVTSTALAARRPARRLAPVADLEALRLRNEAVVAELAAAPVRHVPAALLEALHGSWGTPQELGLVPTQERRLRAVGG